MHFLPGQNYDCVQCAKGCREEWRIHADPGTAPSIADSPLAAEVLRETGLPRVFEAGPDGSRLLARHHGACVFLQANNLCAVHARMGHGHKPYGCREFPWQLVRTPDGVFAGITFYCTAAQQNHGRPLEVHRPEIEALLKQVRPAEAGFTTVRLTDGKPAGITWPVYLRLEELLANGDTGRAIWALCTLSSTDGDVTREALERAWCQARPDLFASDEILSCQEQFFTAAVLCTLEVPDGPARPAAVEEFLAGREVHLPQANWSGTRDALYSLIAAAPAILTETMVRYRRALLFRKFLLLGRPLLDNMIVLHLMPQLFMLYAAIAANRRGAAGMEPADSAYALDQLELFLTHTAGKETGPLFSTFAHACIDQIEMMPVSFPAPVAGPRPG